mmetsp:Transcript_11358/g.30042  ORF Transcript_11358/g.30042 Transcript_11358/m.30042 type:complete len:121 (+) Transcript_11358:1073-1435(+)
MPFIFCMAWVAACLRGEALVVGTAAADFWGSAFRRGEADLFFWAMGMGGDATEKRRGQSAAEDLRSVSVKVGWLVVLCDRRRKWDQSCLADGDVRPGYQNATSFVLDQTLFFFLFFFVWG